MGVGEEKIHPQGLAHRLSFASLPSFPNEVKETLSCCSLLFSIVCFYSKLVSGTSVIRKADPTKNSNKGTYY